MLFRSEQYRAGQNVIADPISVPTANYRNGDFTEALGRTSLGNDLLGNAMFTNKIYDPSTRRTVNGSVVADAFPGNIIPKTRLDPVALKVQSLIPSPTIAGLTNNYQGTYPQERVTQVPSIKVDQVVTGKHKFSFLANRTKIGRAHV